MTKKEFKAAMLRGQGRCVIAVRQEPEKYRDTVLWACTKNIAYDAQWEGTRSWYVYTMASCYPDKEVFIEATADALRSYRPRVGWTLMHLAQLLMWFAEDGFAFARQAVEEKYQKLFAAMLARKRRPQGVFCELDDLEQLGLFLATDSQACCRIAADYGRLYQEKSYLLDGDFSWFFSEKGSQYKKSLAQAAKKNGHIACFLKRAQADVDAQKEDRNQRRQMSPESYTGARLSLWLAYKADKETVQRYAGVYREQKQPRLRAMALEAFGMCPYPDDPQPILDDAKSPYKGMRRIAWRALENIRHPAVRAFALDNAANGLRTPENFAVLVKNYLPEYSGLLEELLRELIAAKDWEGVHAAGLPIYRTFYKNSGIPHPKHLLPLLYEHTPCSLCRESALAYMSRHRMVAKEIWEECLYDSNEDIRRKAQRRLNK